ncbi:MAG: DNA polymerase III subunit gamma/tau [Chloroflexota bacterium]|nr:DNA polymerase III subunit gamma/tau [Chloroflexota bacterium]
MTEGSLFDVSTLDSAPPPADAASPAAAPSQTQSLYRKYRPQSFAEDDLFGQDHIVNTLRNAIALNRIAHAYLFCGPRGTGKTTTARLLAKAVNCLDPDPHSRPCNVCDACVAINRNATTDVIEIDAASNRGIDDIRDLRERVKYAPTQLSTKFYIVDEAHQITGAAANAFLKTLEEPPPHTKFVLATTDPEELLQTIVSRCQRFDFRRINLDAMIACLQKVARLEGIEIEPDAIPVIARHATGSLRDALGVLDQVAVYRETSDSEQQPVTVDTVRTILGVSRNDRVESLVLALADQDAAAGLRAINEAVEAGDDIRQLGRQLVAYLRMLLLHRAGGASDADETAKSLADRFTLSDIAEFARVFADMDVKVKHAAFPQLPLEIAMVTCASRSEQPSATGIAPTERPSAPGTAQDGAPPSPRRQAPPERERPSEPDAPRVSLRDRVRGQVAPPGAGTSPDAAQAPPLDRQRRERPGSNGQVMTPPVAEQPRTIAEPRPSPPPVEQPRAASGDEITLDTIVELWSKIRADVKAVNRRIEALLQQIDPVTVAGGKIFLVSAYEFHRNRMNSDEARTVVEDVISRLVKQRVQVSCVSREEGLAMNTTHRSSEPMTSLGAPSTTPEVERSLPDESAVAPEPEVNAAPQVEAAAGDEGPSRISSPEADAQRIQAAKNIFDAEEIDD